MGLKWYKYELQLVGGRVQHLSSIHAPTVLAGMIAHGDAIRDFGVEDEVYYFGRHVIKCQKIS